MSLSSTFRLPPGTTRFEVDLVNRLNSILRSLVEETEKCVLVDGSRSFTGGIESTELMVAGGNGGQLLKFANQELTPDVGESVSGISLSVRNTDTVPANSFVWGLVINTEGDTWDSGGAIGGTNLGDADWLYVNNRGKTTGATYPTGIGIELNKASDGSEYNEDYAGYGIQIYDFSETSNEDGAIGLFGYKANNPDSAQHLVRLEGNRNLLILETPEGTGYSPTTQILFGIQKTDGSAKANFTSDGQLNFINNLGISFTSLGTSANSAWIFCSDDNPSWLSLRGGLAGTRILNNAHTAANMLVADDGDTDISGDLNVASGKVYKVNSTQVVGAQQSHIADASTSHAITDPGDSPADADALRDDLVTNTIPAIESALNALGTKINTILSMIETHGLTASS